MTDLDKKLQEIASKNWEQFVFLLGEDTILSAKICLLRQNKMSYGQIQAKLKLPKHKVEYACNKCETDISIC